MDVQFNTTTTPVLTVGIIAITVVVLAIIIFRLIEKFKTVKVGPLELRITKEHMGDTHLSHMGIEVDDLEKDMRDKLDDIVDKIRVKISNLFVENKFCSIIRWAISNTLKEPLSRAVRRNNFYKHLAHSNYQNYRTHIISQIMDNYIEMQIDVKAIRCTITEFYQEWDAVSSKVITVVDICFDQLISAVIQTVQAILEVYKRYERELGEDQYRKDIVGAKIKEYNNILTDLERRTAPRENERGIL